MTKATFYSDSFGVELDFYWIVDGAFEIWFCSISKSPIKIYSKTRESAVLGYESDVFLWRWEVDYIVIDG